MWLMMEKVKQAVRNIVVDSEKKMTPGDVEKAVAGTADVDRKAVRLAIKDLVSKRELTYTYLYGNSFLEKSFDRPVRLSKRIVIKPPDKAYQPEPGEVVVNIAGGAAFGNGAHPSTRLALRALDSTLGDHRYIEPKAPLRGLDVGTGTGILAIALAKLGVQEVIGLDIDTCAVSEASHNVWLNDLGEQITVSSTPLEEVTTCFSVIVANMPYPTLSRLTPLLSAKMEVKGLLILSGFRVPASIDLGQSYAEHGFRVVRKEIERGWVCMTFRKMGRGCT